MGESLSLGMEYSYILDITDVVNQLSTKFCLRILVIIYEHGSYGMIKPILLLKKNVWNMKRSLEIMLMEGKYNRGL